MERIFQELRVSPYYIKYKEAFPFLAFCTDDPSSEKIIGEIMAELKTDHQRLGKSLEYFGQADPRYLLLDLLGVKDEKYWMGFQNYHKSDPYILSAGDPSSIGHKGMAYQTGSGNQADSLNRHFLSDIKKECIDLPVQEMTDYF